MKETTLACRISYQWEGTGGARTRGERNFSAQLSKKTPHGRLYVIPTVLAMSTILFNLVSLFILGYLGPGCLGPGSARLGFQHIVNGSCRLCIDRHVHGLIADAQAARAWRFDR